MPNQYLCRLIIAAIALVTIGALSACQQRGKTVLVCGGTLESRCPRGTYCDFGAECGGIDRMGSCKPIPQNCPEEDKPVCGCDKKNYASACYANGSEVTVAYSGPCAKSEGLTVEVP